MNKILVLLSSLLIFTSCATHTPYDYSAFERARPRSILVLPPLNQSPDVKATYGHLSTITRPLAEKGYYVYPVSVIDQFLKSNGMPGPGEMHQAPLSKIDELIGADAVLYITIKKYGAMFAVVSSHTRFLAEARLVATKSGEEIWSGKLQASNSSQDTGNLLGNLINAVVKQVTSNVSDEAHKLSRRANYGLIRGNGILNGPYLPTQSE